ncbi:MAG TPA: flagellar hook-associated protein FlgK [Steroidobacteraceae bacterium]|nr:flagellar hook-associated protein FlgK [Steroidobacteraceae bacterium]
MSDLFGISVGALQAFQSALNVTSNNIANANTPGYAKESVELTAAKPQSNGNVTIGSGVTVSGISRSFSQATANQLNASQSALGQLNALQSYSSQIDNLVGTTAGGLSTALQNFYGAWSDVANSPASTATRQALLGKAQSVAASLQSNSTQLDALNGDINARITSDVQQINTLATSISKLNTQIVVSTAQAGGQAPNELIDQRDQLVSNLSKLTGISTTLDTNGALNVFVGNGQPLVLQGNTTSLTTVANQFDASQLEISTSTSNGNVISSTITSGELGGLLAARSQVVNPTKNQLGQIATALNQTVNQQQNAGLDLTGQLGANLFSVGAPLAAASTKNTGGVAAAVSVTNVGALTTNDYLLSYKGGAYSLTNAADGSTVPFSGNGTVATPLTADGLSIVLSGTPASGDQFLIRPTVQAAGSFSVLLSNPSKIAAAGAVQATSAAGNTGSATISSGTVVNAANPSLLATTTLAFTSATTYSVNGAGSFTYTPGANITQNGWQVQISGTPAVGDTFTVQSNAGGTGDNRNALLSANLQSTPVLQNGTASVSSAVSALVTGIGSKAEQINTAQTAQAAVNTQAVTDQQSVSGVNLDEEAAHLLQWQQAYQAAAKALQIGSSLFQSLLTAVQSA